MRTSADKRVNKKLIITVASVAILLIAGATTLAYTQKWWPFSTPDNHIIDGINYGPPTKEEVENSQDAKKDILEEDKKNNNEDKANLKKVSIGVSHSDVIDGNVEIRAFVSGVVEGTGTCTATLSRTGAQTVVKTSKAFIDASTSQCEPILIPVSQFGQSGEWTLVVSYKSPTSTGESEKLIVAI